MAANIGPLFALQASAPSEWNRALSSQRILKTTVGQAWNVEVPSVALRQSLDQGVERWVFIAQVLREDGESLFGFDSVAERALFIELRELDSIGSKYAAVAVAELGPSRMLRLAQGMDAGITKVPGLGPKTLEKIKTGLREKREKFLPLLQWQSQGAAASAASHDAPDGNAPVNAGWVPDIILQALTKVGLKPQDVERVYRALDREQENFSQLGLGEQVKLMLARWGQNKNRPGASAPNSEGPGL